jgi:hypothetical protein
MANDPILSRLPYREIWVCDWEFNGADGDIKSPVCLTATELRTNRLVRLWADQLGDRAPYALDKDSLFIAYFASAEFSCHLALGWPLPETVLDLFTQFRARMNSDPVIVDGNGEINALNEFRIDNMGQAVKDANRDFILALNQWICAPEDRQRVLDYCQRDTDDTVKLFYAMAPRIEWPYALIRGRYMKAVARMEHTGVPIDVPTFRLLRDNWGTIRRQLVEPINAKFGFVYDEELSFREQRFANWLAENQMPWPKLPSGDLDLQDKTFKRMATRYGQIEELRELRKTLSQVRPDTLAVGSDGFTRCLLSPFASKTGRNQPRKSIFGAASWMRHLIKAPEGYAVVYCDYSQEEFGVAARLSNDPVMLAAYQSGDSYLGFGKQAHTVPEYATKQTHPEIRERYKTGILSTQYDTTARTLAFVIKEPPCVAKRMIHQHHLLYRKYWEWSETVINHAKLFHYIRTSLGWRMRVTAGTKSRTLRNWPIQAAGAEIIRLLCCEATEQGLRICIPVHDAVLLLSPLDRVEDDVRRLLFLMEQASALILGGLNLRAEPHDFPYPQRYQDDKGASMWEKVQALMRLYGWRGDAI